MLRNSPLKQLTLFAIGSALNVALFCISKYLGFPLWLDYTGSFYITAVCGPVLGAASVLLHTVLLTALIDGVSAMWLLIPMILTAAVIYTAKQLELLSSPFSHISAVFIANVAAFLGNFIVFIIDKMPPERYGVFNDAFSALTSSHGRLFGTVLAALAISFAEMIPSLALFSVAYRLTPRPKSSLSFKK